MTWFRGMIPNHPLNLGSFNAALIHVRHRHAGPPTPQHTSQCRHCIHFSRSNNDAVDRTRSTSGLALLDHKSLFYSYCNLVQLHLLWDKHQHWLRKIGFNFPHLLIWSIKCNWNSQPFRNVSLLLHTCIVHIFTSTKWICAAAKKEKRCISQILFSKHEWEIFRTLRKVKTISHVVSFVLHVKGNWLCCVNTNKYFINDVRMCAISSFYLTECPGESTPYQLDSGGRDSPLLSSENKIFAWKGR